MFGNTFSLYDRKTCIFAYRKSHTRTVALKYLLLFFTQLCLWFPARAQPVAAQAETPRYDSLIHRPYAQRINGYHYLYVELLGLKDSVALARRTAQVKAFARQENDRELEMEMDLFRVYHDAFFRKIPTPRAITAIEALIARSEREKIEHIHIRAVRVLAQYYWEQKSYERAFEQYMLLDKKLRATNVYEYPELVRDLLKIGEAYYFFHDYERAKSYFERIIRLPENDFNTMFMNSARNTLGLCYQKEKDYRRSDYYFQEILKTRFELPKKLWRRIAMGNLGTNCYYRGEYDKAIPLLQYDFEGAIREADYGPAAGASILLADIFLGRNQREKSREYFTAARECIEKAGQKDRLQLLYPVMSKWYSAAGDGHLSRLYLDSTIQAINAYQEQFSATKILRAQQKINLQEEELRQAELTLEKQQKANQRVLLFIVASAAVIILTLGYFVQKKKQQAKDLQIQAAALELETATLRLKQFTESITEKNRLIEQLQSQRSENEHDGLIGRLQQSSILTEEDWQTFQRLFDKAYPGFITRAKEAYNDLSLSELRYFVLSRMKLSYREMAAMLGVSPNTVQVLRHRIRKKHHFADNEELEDVITHL